MLLFIRFSIVIIIHVISTLEVFLCMTSFSLMAVNGGHKFSEIKVKKRMTSNVHNGLKFGEICIRKSYCTRKCKKMNIKNLIIVALKDSIGCNHNLTHKREVVCMGGGGGLGLPYQGDREVTRFQCFEIIPPPRPPRGGTQKSFIRGGSAPRSNPLPFYMPFFQKKHPFRIPFI